MPGNYPRIPEIRDGDQALSRRIPAGIPDERARPCRFQRQADYLMTSKMSPASLRSLQARRLR